METEKVISDVDMFKIFIKQSNYSLCKTEAEGLVLEVNLKVPDYFQNFFT